MHQPLNKQKFILSLLSVLFGCMKNSAQVQFAWN